jgi:hypothetical protein
MIDNMGLHKYYLIFEEKKLDVGNEMLLQKLS